MRNGEPCEECLKRGTEWGCISHNCENSAFKSLGYALRNAAARWRKDYKECVDRFACITDFQRRKLIEAGYDAAKMFVIPNAVECSDIFDEERYGEGEYVAYIGRISKEKGVDMIIETARKNPAIPFRLAGAVRDEALVADLPANVELAGFLSGDEYLEFLRGARFMVMASRWYEGFPMGILEASRQGKPTIGPDHGGFTEILKGAGVLFRPGDNRRLSDEVSALWGDIERTMRLGKAARQRLEQQYSLGAVASKWQLLLRSMMLDVTNPLPRPATPKSTLL